MAERIAKRLFPGTLSQPDKANAAMFHIGRSGSAVLGDLLHQHSDIFWGGELLDSRRFKFLDFLAHKHGLFPFDPFSFIRINMRQARGACYGFETKFFHLSRNGISLPDYLDELQNMGFDHFIVLKRRNYLRKVISSLIGKQTARYHQSHVKKPSLHRISLDVDAIAIDGDVCPLLLRFQRWDESFEKLERLLQGQQTLKLTYEDDIAGNPKIAYQQICAHLDLEPVDVHIRYGKTNPFPIKDMIINCADVEEALSNTGYDWMLHE